MGKQINFFMLPEDLVEIDAKVKELGLTIIADRMPTEEIIVLDSLINDYDDMYLLLEEDLKEVKSKYMTNQKIFWIHPMQVPAMEFSKSLYRPNLNFITLGRIYYDKEYRNSKLDYETKNDLLTNNIDKLFKWFRGKFKQKIEGYPIGDYTYNFVKQNNFLLNTGTQTLKTN